MARRGPENGCTRNLFETHGIFSVGLGIKARLEVKTTSRDRKITLGEDLLLLL